MTLQNYKTIVKLSNYLKTFLNNCVKFGVRMCFPYGKKNKSDVLMCKRSLILIFKNLTLYFLRLYLFMIELCMSWIFLCYLFYNHMHTDNNELAGLRTFFLSMKMHVISSKA